MSIKKQDGPKLIKINQANTLVNLAFDRNRLVGLAILFPSVQNMKLFIKRTINSHLLQINPKLEIPSIYFRKSTTPHIANKHRKVVRE